jgi:hypothetical protein
MALHENFVVDSGSVARTRALGGTYRTLIRSLACAPATRIVGLVALVHTVLTLAVLIGARAANSLGEGVVGQALGFDPYGLPGAWLRYDTNYYLNIARAGYTAGGPELAFMPMYALLVRGLAFTSDPNTVAWTGLVLSNVAFCGALVLLWYQVRQDHGEGVAWKATLALTLFPTALFFSAFYTEGLFLFWSVLIYWVSRRGKYALAGVLVALASLTRMNGLCLVVIPVAELLLTRPVAWRRRLLVTMIVSGLGLAAYGAYLFAVVDSPLSVLAVQQTTFLRGVALPWKTVMDSLMVVLGRDSFADNKFMRFVSGYDLASTLLLVGCAVASIRLLRPSLAAYLIAALVVLTTSHGPYTLGLYSMSRYVLVLFPGFIVLGLVLDRRPRLSWCVWVVLLALLVPASAWFGAGRWIA